MPCFLVPIHEFNQCHEPSGSPAGGEFCSTGAGSSPQAQYFGPGEAIDLAAAASSGDRSSGRRLSRRFLFNPNTGEFVIGVATGTPGRDQSHAEAFNAATQHNKRLDYDDFTVHGHLLADTPASAASGLSAFGTGGRVDPFAYGPLAVQVDRIASLTSDQRERGVEKLDAFYKFLSWATRHGAGKTTPLWDYSFSGLTAAQKQAGGPLGKMYPDLFPKAKRRKLPKAA